MIFSLNLLIKKYFRLILFAIMWAAIIMSKSILETYHTIVKVKVSGMMGIGSERTQGQIQLDCNINFSCQSLSYNSQGK